MRRWLQYGGFAAGIVLIAFGAVAIAMGVERALDRERQPAAGEDRRLARHDAGG